MNATGPAYCRSSFSVISHVRDMRVIPRVALNFRRNLAPGFTHYSVNGWK
jgi:hypothetical protein